MDYDLYDDRQIVDGRLIANHSIDQRVDIQSALQKMPNARYRQVIEELDLQDVQPEKLAKEMNFCSPK